MRGSGWRTCAAVAKPEAETQRETPSISSLPLKRLESQRLLTCVEGLGARAQRFADALQIGNARFAVRGSSQ